MLGIVGHRANVLVAQRHVNAEEAIGVGDRAFFAQFVQDRIGIFDPARIERVEKTRRVRSEWRLEESRARPRKYYALTAEGERDLTGQTREWRRLASALSRFLDRERQR